MSDAVALLKEAAKTRKVEQGKVTQAIIVSPLFPWTWRYLFT